MVPKEEYDKLAAENKKLKYRMKFLLRALDGESGDSSGPAMTLSIPAGESATSLSVLQCLFVGKLTGCTLKVTEVDSEAKDVKAKNPLGKYPLLETKDGCLAGVVAIVKYMARVSKKLLGDTPQAQAKVDQWINWTSTTLAPLVGQVSRGIFGREDAQILNAHWKECSTELKKQQAFLNTSLDKSKYLVGDQMTLADVFVATVLIEPLQTVNEANYRKSIKNVEAWVTGIYREPAFTSTFGAIHLCAKPMKPICLPDPVKPKEEKKAKAAPAPKKEEKKPEKKKDNVESLPPTDFDLFGFKTYFVNVPDKKGEGIDTFYKQLDWKGWSFWHLHYDIYEGEGDKLHVCNNLLGGFLNRAEHTSKYTFGRMAVLGEEGSLQIEGCWLFRGQEVPDGLAKEHPQFEYYKARKLDHKNKDDDKLIREFWGGKEGDMMNNMVCQTLKWHK